MNLDHDFFQVSKLSEDQKKGLHQKWNSFFPQIQVKTKKRSSLKMELFFSPNSGEDQKKIQEDACAHMHTRVKLLEGMQIKTILKL